MRLYRNAFIVMLLGAIAVGSGYVVLRSGGGSAAMWMALVIGFVVVFVVKLVLAQRHSAWYAQLRRDEYRRCRGCGYSLVGLDDVGRCPECDAYYELVELKKAWTRWERPASEHP